MNRRDALKLMAASFSFAVPALISSKALAATAYDGPIFINIHARGGLDQSSFIDPKNDEVINRWAITKSYGEAGNIRYAPMGDNAYFFDTYYDRMMVVNGVDAQTNAHAAASRVRWTGQLSTGHPSISELLASHYGQGLPLAYISAGGFEDNVGLMPFNKTPTSSQLAELSVPNHRYGGRGYLKEGDLSQIEQARIERLQAIVDNEANLPRRVKAAQQILDSFESRQLIVAVNEFLPESIDSVDRSGSTNRMVQQAHISLICAQAGLTSCINLQSPHGFDSHSDLESEYAERLPLFTNAIDYIWKKAEELGIEDRIIMHINSDVGRRPYFNAGDGKDHWRHSSCIFMQKDAPWANRVVGATDAGLESLAINPQTLAVDEAGVVITPQDIQAMYRKLAGIENSAGAKAYALKDVTEFNAFDPSKSTGYIS